MNRLRALWRWLINRQDVDRPDETLQRFSRRADDMERRLQVLETEFNIWRRSGDK